MKELSIEEKAKAYDEIKYRINKAYNENRCTIGFVLEIFPNITEYKDIIEYKQKYKEALERAKPYHNDYTKDIIEDIFPELKESSSEDEKIRKRIIHALHGDVLDMEETKEAIAWLEKQGNQEVTVDFKAKDLYVSKVDNKIHNIYDSSKSALETIKEEKVDNANKVELPSFDEAQGTPIINKKVKPTFKVGDWVIITAETGEYTVEIIDISYFRSCHPMYITSEGRWFGNGTKARLWNINYAKDGDILYYDDEVFIYKNLDNSINYYACWDGKNIHLNSFYLLTLEEIKTIKPATKEQRRELLKHLNNAGYIWVNERKELFTLNKND